MPVIPRFALSLSPGDLAYLAGSLLGGRVPPDAVRSFEDAFSAYLGSGPSLFVPSARAGLYGLFKILDIPPGSKVILPAWTHPSVPAAVVAAGLRPWFVDVDAANLAMDPKDITADALEGARALIATHLYGTPCNIEELQSIARERGLVLIEDCAQSLGARYRGRLTGTFGDAAYFSFALTKNFTTLGGGAVVVRDPALRERLRSLVGECVEKPPVRDIVKAFAFAAGTCPLVFACTLYPLLLLSSLRSRDPLHEAFEEKVPVAAPFLPLTKPAGVRAALGLRRLPLLDEGNSRRREHGEALLAMLDGVPREILPAPPSDTEPIFMSFVLKVSDRVRISRELLARGIDSSPGYLGPCYRLPAFAQYARSCPTAEELAARQLHLPLYPSLSARRLRHIADGLQKVLRPA